MDNNLLLGLLRCMVPVPRVLWQMQVSRNARHLDAGLDFMSTDHHRVRNFVVSELPRQGRPLSPDFIAHSVNLSSAQVNAILEDLEKHMTFLFRNDLGAVTWAYPVTVDTTPHHVALSTGEQIYAAWAVDAVAVPFVQGQLRGEHMSGLITTECAHCRQPLHIEIDSELHYRVVETGAKPMFFAPLVVVEPGAKSIIDGFWRRSVFFWSEEHARHYRRTVGGVRGTYLTLSQGAYITPILQGALFAFPRRRWQGACGRLTS